MTITTWYVRNRALLRSVSQRKPTDDGSKNADASGRNLTNGVEKYYPAEKRIQYRVMTIDEVIQHYVENALEQVTLDTDADRAMATLSWIEDRYILGWLPVLISISE